MMIQLIQEHLSKYPKMQAQDIIKLIYQNEFGGGHMIDNCNLSLERIRDEVRGVEGQGLEYEEIGNDLIRVYLGDLNELQMITLNQLFVYCANQTRGSIDSFINKLEELKLACKTGKINFDYGLICKEIDKYEKLNYPPISHSHSYHETYQPHYRVLNKKVFDYFEIILKINELLLEHHSLNVAIDGKCGSGKSTLGRLIATIYNANLFKMDDFFLQSFQRNEARLALPGGNVDYERFKETVIEPLKQKENVEYQRFDCSKMALDEHIEIINYCPINVIEGTYSMHPYFGSFYDYTIALNISDSMQEKRILERNGKIMLEKFKKIWIPLENKYFESYDIFNQADYLYDCTLKTII